MSAWSIEEASKLYHVSDWGNGFFSIGRNGNVLVHPTREKDVSIDLKVLVDEVQERGIQLPILFRFTDILEARVRELNASFARAIREFGYQSKYRGVYPIKVNQQRQVVESILAAGKSSHLGLEAGSKPELLTIMSMMNDPKAIAVCNGYKDPEFIELALLGRKLGMNIILVIEKFSELDLILKLADEVGVRPSLGIRARLASRGAGKWQASGGERAKFGLNATEILQVIDVLQERNRLDELQLLHYHLGSQICSVNTLKAALREAGRYYVELRRLAADLQYFDVGGGLAVDYDGSRSDTESSANYTVQEYANSVVDELMTVCDQSGVPHPVIVTESGRALTAYHSVLVTNVLGVTHYPTESVEEPQDLDDAPSQVVDLWEIYNDITIRNVQERYHDIMHLRQELLDLFNLGYIRLHWRACGEAIARGALSRILRLTRKMPYIPEELGGLETELADIYFCNLSVFQSIPDAWAIDQVFPIMPVHRMRERPARQAVLADITCDSDGKIDRFVDLRHVRRTLPVHETRAGEAYLLGFFLVGAYQEILGDLHNLFGDNNAVQVTWDAEEQTYGIEHVEDGDTVTEVLNYVQQSREDLIKAFRARVERAVRSRRISIEASRRILETYRHGFDGYTYMEQ